jgi:hypothetical protein
MSGIESLSALNTGSLSSLVQTINSQSQSGQAVGDAIDESTGASTEEGTNDRGIDALKTKIDAAISEALKNLDKTASADQIMQTVKSAIDGVLKENGIDPEEMKQGMQPAGQDMANMPPPPPPNGSGGGSDDLMSKIESLLQGNGFDVENFKSELAAKMTQQTSNSGLKLLDDLSSTQGIDTQA